MLNNRILQAARAALLSSTQSASQVNPGDPWLVAKRRRGTEGDAGSRCPSTVIRGKET